MSDEEWVHAGPHQPDADSRLHAAFGAELETLTIGPSPTGAVLRDGVALRKRRRTAWTGGVAGLLVLPVAAVLVFGGGAGSGGGSSLTAGSDRTPKPHSTPKTTPAPTPPALTTALPTATPSQPPTTGPTNNPAYPKPPASPPDPQDEVTVLGSGTYNGHAWRLVRDRFIVVTHKGSMVDPLQGPHLPFSAATRSDTVGCEFVGFQWGDLAPGTRPDFNAGGACGTELKTLGKRGSGASGFGLLAADPEVVAPGSFGGLWATGVVDPSRVATVSVTVGAVTVGPTPVFRHGTEPVAYWGVTIPYPDADKAESSLPGIQYTYYDANGVVVGTGQDPFPNVGLDGKSAPATPTPPPTPTK